MCQFNLIIIKTPAAAAFLEKLGYYLAYPLQYGYNAWCRQQFCNCGSVAGSCYRELMEKGNYPDALGYNDYKRISKKKADFLQEQITLLEAAWKRQREDDFAERESQFRAEEKKYKDRLLELFRERLPKYEKFIVHDHSKLEPAPPGEEEIALQKEYQRFREGFREKDPVLFAAIETPSEYMLQSLASIKSRSIYNHDAKEFRYYRRIFSRLLKLEECVYFTHIWDRPGELKLVNTLSLEELRISDLALLAQDDVIKIRR